MFKRLFSKKSGFTLVEIIIAFVIFALFATMIMQILNMVTLQRKSNAQLSDKIDEQELALLTKTKKNFDGSSIDGTLELDFGEYGKVATDYQMYGKFVGDSADGLEVDGLAYFQGDEIVSAMPPVDSDPDDGDDDDDDTNDGGSQMDRVNTRIAGSRGLEFVSINKIVKYNLNNVKREYKYVCEQCGREFPGENYGWDGCPSSPAGTWSRCHDHIKKHILYVDGDESYVVYAFDLCAQMSDMNTSDIPYGNYRLYFYNNAGKPVEIAYANYLNADSIDSASDTSIERPEITSATADTGGSSPSSKNKYTVSLTGANGIRIGSPINTSGGVPFEESNHTRIEIAFKTDPGLTVSSFGVNGVMQADGSCHYEPNAAVGSVEDVGPNIYGAYPK